MSLTLAKLQQLKRQAGAGSVAIRSAPAPSSAAPSLEHLRSQLRLRVPPPLRPIAHDRTLPGEELAPGLHYREERVRHDDVPLHFDGAFDRRDHPLTSSNLLFFDTETTGLAGGTGTRAFMIGTADWYEGSLRIRQLTISTMAGETAMLEAFSGWLMPGTVLVSYNGKCYDSPLLATRYRLARMANPLARLDHIDLLYPTRRSYRGVYENCRLATIERRVLKVVREDDLPGSEAPAAWLTYIRGGNATMLRRVLAHNFQDVMSLSRLLRHLTGPIETTPENDHGAQRSTEASDFRESVRRCEGWQKLTPAPDLFTRGPGVTT